MENTINRTALRMLSVGKGGKMASFDVEGCKPLPSGVLLYGSWVFAGLESHVNLPFPIFRLLLCIYA